MRRPIIAAALAIVAASCAGIGAVDSDAQWQTFEDHIALVHPGMPEDSLLALFDRVGYGDPAGKIGVLDVERFEAQGYLSRTWFIGFRRSSGAPRPIVSVECVNGRVANIMTHR